ncbi:hypothetical protein IFT75_00065 [Pseudomonas sp. CFBP 8758]|uniref:hypothetical protein n=1 Tax=Pseudomonas sp. CFBP 8758 TaxID=2775286 RepID=UPI00177BEBB5|nr:hypothetical protein [Pseudomonas sp. CFBP 8758]MBD8591809.1 hypothetical protein [Pseudomonas sp. CFBP 8758]
MEVESNSSSIEKPFQLISKTSLTVLLIPIFSFVGYYAPYMTGLAYHQALLKHYGIPQGLLDQDTSYLFVYAYQALLDISGNWWPFISRPSVIGVVFWALLLFGLEVATLVAFDRKGKISAALNRRLKKPWIVVGCMIALVSFCLTTLVVLVPIIAFPILSVPKKLGEWGAELKLKNQVYVGCENETDVTRYCKALVHDNVIQDAGYVVMVSDQWIALYRPAVGTVVLSLGENALKPISPEEFKRFEMNR